MSKVILDITYKSSFLEPLLPYHNDLQNWCKNTHYLNQASKDKCQNWNKSIFEPALKKIAKSREKGDFNPVNTDAQQNCRHLIKVLKICYRELKDYGSSIAIRVEPQT